MTDFEPILRDANRRLSAEVRHRGQSPWAADLRGQHLTALVRIGRRSEDVGGRVVELTEMRMPANAYLFRWAWTNL